MFTLKRGRQSTPLDMFLTLAFSTFILFFILCFVNMFIILHNETAKL